MNAYTEKLSQLLQADLSPRCSSTAYAIMADGQILEEDSKRYYKILLETDYEKIEKNNLAPYLSQVAQLGYLPGKIYGKVLVSAEDQGLKNYYEGYIEMLEC